MEQKDAQTYAIIGAALEVHNQLGHGFLEGIYQEAMAIEFELRGIPFQREQILSVSGGCDGFAARAGVAVGGDEVWAYDHGVGYVSQRAAVEKLGSRKKFRLQESVLDCELRTEWFLTERMVMVC